ncbi:hypothetical protein [Mucilaginibacter rubeus]
MCTVILVLGLMPCKDSSVSSKIFSKVTFQQAHRDKNPVQDHCSPFCHCACCNTPSVTASRPLLFIMANEIDKSYPELSTSKIKNMNVVIWQPPKFNS